MELNFKELAQEIHENAKAKGFYDNKDHKAFKHAQVFEIIKEVAELHEAYKKGKDGTGNWYFENPEEVGASSVFEACIKDTWQDELADVMIRLLDYGAFVGFKFPHPSTVRHFKINRELDNYELGNYCLDWVVKLTLMTDLNSNLPATASIYCVLDFANWLKCNLEWHIKAKMAYNATRERLHGKRF